MTILYLDNEDEVKETNNFTERGEGGGYIIHELAGRNGDYFLPYNRVLPYSMVGDELQDFILNTKSILSILNSFRIFSLRASITLGDRKSTPTEPSFILTEIIGFIP